MKIDLLTPVVVVTVPEQTREISEVGIEALTDFPTARRVAVTLVGGISFPIWEGDAYDAIGQWTDGDALARIMELATPENIQKWFGRHA